MQSIRIILNNLNISKPIWLMFLFALAVRLWGIAYGLPLQLNIDEPSFVSGTLSLKDSLNPGRFDWPTLYFYINAGFYFLYSIIKPFLTAMFNVHEDAWSPAAYFLISRLLSAVFGSLTVLSIYLLSREIFSHKVGLVAALIIAVLPIHVYESHFAKIDIAHTFFLSIVLYFIWRIYKVGDKRSYLLSGLWIGLSTSIKYNGFLYAIPVIIAYLMRRSEVAASEKNLLKKYFSLVDFKYMLMAAGISILAFYIGTPFALIDYKTFFSMERGVGAMWQFKNVGSVEWPLYPIELYETVIPMFRADMGYIIWIIFSILMLLFLFFNKRTKEYVFLLLPTLILTLYISRLERSPSHYFLMLIPFYVPAIAAFIVEIYERLKGWKHTKFLPLPILAVLIIAPSLYTVFITNYTLARTDTRQLAYNWVKSNLNDDTDLLFIIGDEDELAVVDFKDDAVEIIKELDRDGTSHKKGPFYVLIGVKGLKKEEITEGDRDPKIVPGNSQPILQNADLVFYATDEYRYGPPIYIFKVNYVEPER